MREAFGWDLDRFIYFGGYPGAVDLIADQQRWSRYIIDSLIETTLSRDILLLTRVDKPALLRRLFQLGCSHSSQILSYQKMIGQLQDAGNTTTLAHYLELLAGAGMLTGLHKFAAHRVRERASSPKLQVLNTALISAQSRLAFDEARKDRESLGQAGGIGGRRPSDQQRRGDRRRDFYWRERSREVDFVLQSGKTVVAVEVKSGALKEGLPGMDAFEKAFKPKRKLLVGEDGIRLGKVSDYSGGGMGDELMGFSIRCPSSYTHNHMPVKILLITPPFTQLNTPYPASPYLKGFLKQQGYEVFQADLSIEVMNVVFSGTGFQKLFDHLSTGEKQLSQNSNRILSNKQHYLQTVDLVMNFLQYRDTTLAQRICSDHFLPRASRFDQLPDLEWSFGSIRANDKARFLATLYIEDVGDLIKDGITPYFGFNRYAEKLGMSAHSFAPIDQALQQPGNIIETWMLELLKIHINEQRPDVVGLTIPFPGNLYAALKCGQYIKQNFPHINVVAGGGYVNTELRDLSEPAIFNYLDFITLDDGNVPC